MVLPLWSCPLSTAVLSGGWRFPPSPFSLVRSLWWPHYRCLSFTLPEGSQLSLVYVPFCEVDAQPRRVLSLLGHHLCDHRLFLCNSPDLDVRKLLSVATVVAHFFFGFYVFPYGINRSINSGSFAGPSLWSGFFGSVISSADAPGRRRSLSSLSQYRHPKRCRDFVDLIQPFPRFPYLCSLTLPVLDRCRTLSTLWVYDASNFSLTLVQKFSPGPYDFLPFRVFLACDTVITARALQDAQSRSSPSLFFRLLLASRGCFVSLRSVGPPVVLV